MIISQTFEIARSRVGRTHVLTPIGNLNGATAPILDRTFHAVVTELEEDELIALNLAQLTSLDAAAIRVLQRLQAWNGRVRILGIPRRDQLADTVGPDV